jgi:hypothetical protein
LKLQKRNSNIWNPLALVTVPNHHRRVSFSDLLVSSPSQQEQPRICLGTVFFLPRGEVFARPRLAATSQPPQKRSQHRHWKLPTRIDLWPRPLFSRGHCSGGNPVGAAYAPGSWLHPAQMQYYVL